MKEKNLGIAPGLNTGHRTSTLSQKVLLDRHVRPGQLRSTDYVDAIFEAFSLSLSGQGCDCRPLLCDPFHEPIRDASGHRLCHFVKRIAIAGADNRNLVRKGQAE